MTFIEYLQQWISKYPHLDVYYHMKYIEQAYKEQQQSKEENK